MTLSAEQNSAMEEFANGDNILITGPGGSGKSYLIKLIKENSESRGKNIQVCAMTGCAAVLLQCKAKTVHSWGGIGIGSGDPKDIIKRVIKNKHKKKAWKAVDVLVIGEAGVGKFLFPKSNKFLDRTRTFYDEVKLSVVCRLWSVPDFVPEKCP